MKSKFIALFSCLMLGGLNAASISLSNFDGVNFTGVLDSQGQVLTSGVVVLGAFSVEPTSIADIFGPNFTQAGNSLSVGANSFFQGNVNTGALVAGDDFVGNVVYVVIGNGVDLGSSTDFLIWKSTNSPISDVFVADNPVGGPDTVNVTSIAGELSVGQTTTFDFGNGTSTAFQLVAIPEPSTFLLGAVGVLGLLRRRR